MYLVLLSSHSRVTCRCALCVLLLRRSVFFFFNATSTTEIYTLSLHDALPICNASMYLGSPRMAEMVIGEQVTISAMRGDRKSTRLNSSHQIISYAVFCLKKKKKKNKRNTQHRASMHAEPHRWVLPRRQLPSA